MRRVGMFTLFALAASGCSGPTEKPVAIPSLDAGGWLNVPGGKSTLAADALAGKAVFVEFWATW